MEKKGLLKEVLQKVQNEIISEEESKEAELEVKMQKQLGALGFMSEHAELVKAYELLCQIELRGVRIAMKEAYYQFLVNTEETLADEGYF